MATIIGPAGRRPASGPRPASRLLPPRYQTIANWRDVLVPLILVYSILLPAGLAPEVAGITLPPYRLAILGLVPFALLQLGRRRIRLGLPDLLIIAGSLWGFFAMFTNSTIGEGLQAGGSFVVDTLGSYLIGRAYITDVRKLRCVLLFALPGVLTVAAILVIEAVSHRLLIAPLFPQRASLENLYETRLGLLRARAVFPHSIAAGLFMGSLLSLYFLSQLQSRWRMFGIVAAMAALFTGSSSAYLMIAMLGGLMAYKFAFNRLLGMQEKWIYLLAAGATIFLMLETFTGRGAIRTLIQIVALNPRSAYYRLVIWDYGTESVERNPWFGIGNAAMQRADWMFVETIDNHWLMLAVRYGLPTSVLIALGVTVAIFLCVVRNKRLNDFDRSTTLGAVFALAALSTVAWTTGLWANHVAWYMIIVGTVSALANQLPQRAPQTVQRPMRRPGPVRRSA